MVNIRVVKECERSNGRLAEKRMFFAAVRSRVLRKLRSLERILSEMTININGGYSALKCGKNN